MVLIVQTQKSATAFHGVVLRLGFDAANFAVVVSAHVRRRHELHLRVENILCSFVFDNLFLRLSDGIHVMPRLSAFCLVEQNPIKYFLSLSNISLILKIFCT